MSENSTRRTRGEGSHSTDPRTGRRLYRTRSLVPGRMITGRGDTPRAAVANAKERAAHILAGRSSGKPETFGEMLHAWLSLEARPNLTLNTFRTYRSGVTRWLIPALGDVPADQIRPSHLQSVYSAALDLGRSRRTLEAVKTSASLAFDWAISDGRMAGHPPGSMWNPARTSKLPRRTPTTTSRSAPDLSTVEAYLGVADGRWNGAVWRIMAECATRPSEAAALRWSDIEWDTSHIRLRGAIRFDESAEVYRWDGGMKNGEAGERDIEIGPELLSALHSHRTAMRELQLASRWESGWADNLVFRRPADGRALDMYTLRPIHRGIMAELGIGLGEAGWFTPYQFRHHLPTRMAANGVPLSVCAGLLGIDERTAKRYYIDRPETVVDYSIIREALGR